MRGGRGCAMRRLRWRPTSSACWSRCWLNCRRRGPHGSWPRFRAWRATSFMRARWRPSRRSEIEEARRLQIEHGLRALVHKTPAPTHDAERGPALRHPLVEDFDPKAQFIAGAHRVLPLEVGKPRRSERFRPGEDSIAWEADG